ncbi:hypothetical protein [Methanosarcina sp. DH1]|nr:hypothetical protein [Methanosarcina sp. DH1]
MPDPIQKGKYVVFISNTPILRPFAISLNIATLKVSHRLDYLKENKEAIK